VNAINMAASSGIGVLVDLHGAVGSQNGQPHSGISNGETQLFSSESNMNKTIDVLSFLVEQLCEVTNVVGIELLNEPQDDPKLPSFCEFAQASTPYSVTQALPDSQAIATLRQLSPASKTMPLYVHDGFNLDQFSSYIANRSDFVVQDHHSYFVYTASDNAESADNHTKDIEGNIAGSLLQASSRERRNLVVDEWSCALTPESLSKEANQTKARQEFCFGQLGVYTNVSAGWGFWCELLSSLRPCTLADVVSTPAYMKEDCSDDPGWCFKEAVGNSLPASFHSYGDPTQGAPTSSEDVALALANMRLPSPADVIASAGVPAAMPAEVSPSDAFASDVGPVPRDTWPGEMRELTWSPWSGFWTSWKRDASQLVNSTDYDGLSMTPNQTAISKGYSDGYMTAKLFAMEGMSKLGFVKQYVMDSMSTLGSEFLESEDGSSYEDWFLKGLDEGQQVILTAVKPYS
jgi:hypothetical protein